MGASCHQLQPYLTILPNLLFNQLSFTKAKLSMSEANGALHVMCCLACSTKKKHTFKFTNLQEVSLFDLSSSSSHDNIVCLGHRITSADLLLWPFVLSCLCWDRVKRKSFFTYCSFSSLLPELIVHLWKCRFWGFCFGLCCCCYMPEADAEVL